MPDVRIVRQHLGLVRVVQSGRLVVEIRILAGVLLAGVGHGRRAPRPPAARLFSRLPRFVSGGSVSIGGGKSRDVRGTAYRWSEAGAGHTTRPSQRLKIDVAKPIASNVSSICLPSFLLGQEIPCSSLVLESPRNSAGACAHSCRGHHRQHRLRASLAERIQPQHPGAASGQRSTAAGRSVGDLPRHPAREHPALERAVRKRFSDGLQLATDQRIDVGGVMTPALMHEGAPLNNDFSVVDDFREMTAGVATVFARTGDDFVRVSTSVTKQDGSRAIGTLLDRQHPAYPLLLSGSSTSAARSSSTGTT